MGLINHDVYTCSNGVQKADTYVTLATETIYLTQASSDPTISMSNRTYNVRANYRIYWDEECRNTGKSFIDLQSVNVTLTLAQLDSNLYGSLYNALKVVYPNASDAIGPLKTAPVSEPVSEPVAPVSEPVSEPVAPAAEPVSEPVSEPVAPAAEPVSEPVSEPVAPAADPAL